MKAGTIRLEACKAKETKHLTDGEGHAIYVYPGEMYWRIHFAPFGTSKKDPTRFGFAIYLASIDLLRTIRRLEQKIKRGQLDGTNVIVGTSRETMARFAIKRLGFHKVAGYTHPRRFVKIFMKVDDLIKKTSDIERTAALLAKRYRSAMRSERVRGRPKKLVDAARWCTGPRAGASPTVSGQTPGTVS